MATALEPFPEYAPDTVVPGSIPVATLSAATADVDITWHEGEDELGAYRIAVLGGPAGDGAEWVLTSYDDDPLGSMTVLGRPESVSGLDDLLQALGIGEDAVLSRLDRPEIEPVEPLELARDTEHARIAIANLQQELEALAAATSFLQHRMARQLATASQSAEIPTWLPEALAEGEFASLTDRQQAILLALLRGRTTQEIAAELDMSPNAVRQTLYRARNTLLHGHGR